MDRTNQFTVSIFRSTFEIEGVTFYHYSIHFGDGKSGIYEYGRYNNSDGHLRTRSKKYSDEVLVTAFWTKRTKEEIVQFIQNATKGKSWGITTMHCFMLCAMVVNKYGGSKNHALMGVEETKNWGNSLILMKNLGLNFVGKVYTSTKALLNSY